TAEAIGTTSTSLAAATNEPVTIAHITDVHLYEKNGSQKWFADCLHHIQSHAKKPSFILNTGDSVMDALKVDKPYADMLWKLWRETLQQENSLPIYHCLGNHDHWGLGLEDSSVSNDPDFGKKHGLDNIGLE